MQKNKTKSEQKPWGENIPNSPLERLNNEIIDDFVFMPNEHSVRRGQAKR